MGTEGKSFAEANISLNIDKLNLPTVYLCSNSLPTDLFSTKRSFYTTSKNIEKEYFSVGVAPENVAQKISSIKIICLLLLENANGFRI